MAYHCRPGTADVLDESHGGVFDLVRPGCTSELQIRFHQLIHAGRTNRMAARLQTAHGRNGESAVNGNGPILAEMDAKVGASLTRIMAAAARKTDPS